MYRGNSSRVVPIIIVLIVVVIIIAAAISIGRAIFGGGDSSEPTEQDTSRQALLSTSTDRSVRMTVRGALVADENYRSYQITITPSERKIVTYKGYLEDEIESKDYRNNVQAYEELVYALDKAEMMKGTQLEGEANDLRGLCATGRITEFETLRGSSRNKQLWTSSCSGSKGSLEANLEQVQNLFMKQIPDSEEILDELDLGGGTSQLRLM